VILATEATSSDASAAPRKLTLLVVDDEVLLATMMADQLEDLGYLVAGPAYTLKDGLRLASDALIDGALIDVNLGKTGVSSPIADILIARNIPFLFVSGYDEVPVERFRHIPILSKPFSMDSLTAAVGRMLAAADR
jgi:DNA-binding response OmpR family regulator